MPFSFNDPPGYRLSTHAAAFWRACEQIWLWYTHQAQYDPVVRKQRHPERVAYLTDYSGARDRLNPELLQARRSALSGQAEPELAAAVTTAQELAVGALRSGNPDGSYDQELANKLLKSLDALSDWIHQHAAPVPASGTQQVDGDKPPAAPLNGVARGGGEPTVKPPKPRIPRQEAARLVAEFVDSVKPADRDKITVRMINKATNVSLGMMPRIPAWVDLKSKRRGEPRAVPLTDQMHAAVPNPAADAADPAELAANSEVLEELLEQADTPEVKEKYLAMSPGERWQLLELLKQQMADDRRDQRRPVQRERFDRS